MAREHTAARGGRPSAEERLGRSELEASLAKLERERRLVATLFRVGQAVAQEDDLEEIVQLVTDEATARVGAQFGAFFYNRVDANGESYRLYTIAGVPRSAFDRFPQPRNTDIFRPTFEGTAVMRLDDVTADPRFGRSPPYHGMPPGHLPVRSYLAVPVFAAGGVVAGGLFFGHEDVGVFDEAAEHVAAGIATLAGLAVSRVQLLEAERGARSAAEERARAAVALDRVGDGVVLVDAEGFVRVWNRAATLITGLAAGDVCEQPIVDAVPGWADIVARVPVGPQDGAERPRTLPLEIGDGELWLSLYGVEFEDGVVYAFRDVTAEHRLEDLRADLVATVSHEIRTPVAAVYGAARTLLREGLDEGTRQRLLTILVAESERLAGLVSEILLTSSLDSDQLAVAHDELDLLDVVRAAAGSSELADAQSSVELELPEGAVHVVADRDRVGQVVVNLLENAAKYGSARGDPAVTLRVLPREGRVRVEVADRGPGIPAGEHERIFEKFYRLGSSREEAVRGTGLGLYISRELIVRMEGEMGVDSVEGEGSTFWFELPRAWSAVAAP